MKREAVQDERDKGKRSGKGQNGNEDETEPTSLLSGDMPADRILEAETIADIKIDGPLPIQGENLSETIKYATEKQLHQLVDWAKHIPHFTSLPLDDQAALLRGGWNELMIAGFSHRSTSISNGIMLANGLLITRENAHAAGLGAIFDRILVQVVTKMQEMEMDKTELGCLRAIVLYNPESKGLKEATRVQELRERVYASLEEYCKAKHEDQPGRFAKLLLRLPALRSIGLKCLEHLFFFKLIGDNSMDSFLIDLLEAGQD